MSSSVKLLDSADIGLGGLTGFGGGTGGVFGVDVCGPGATGGGG